MTSAGYPGFAMALAFSLVVTINETHPAPNRASSSAGQPEFGGEQPADDLAHNQ